MIHKKGISPIIATVLLVAFVVSASLYVSGWFTTLTISTTKSVGNKSGEAIGCASAAINIKGVYVAPSNAPGTAGSGRVIIENTGYTDNLVIISAELYDRLGNNFTASNVPIAEFDQGDLETLAFNFPTLGNTTTDSSGLGNNGTLGNGTIGNSSMPLWTLSGKYGSALGFDGIDDYVNASNGSSLNITNTITIEAWIYKKGSTAPNRHQRIASKWGGCIDSASAYQMYLDSNGNLSFELPPASSLISSSIPLTNKWYHIAGTYDASAGGNNMKIYLDGNLISQINRSGTINVNTCPVLIGRSYNEPHVFNGTLDEVRIYNVSLTNEEINRTMNGEIINQSDLVMYMKLDEASGVLQCSDFSKVVVTTSCGGVADTFSSVPTC